MFWQRTSEIDSECGGQTTTYIGRTTKLKLELTDLQHVTKDETYQSIAVVLKFLRSNLAVWCKLMVHLSV